MSKPGPKRQSPEEKQAKGTYNTTRDKPVHIIVQHDPPLMPSYLSADAQAIWHEEIDRIVKAGFGELDSSFFAGYCAMEAAWRANIIAGSQTTTALATELRRRQEMLGIAGPSSRALLGTTNPQASDPWDLPEA